MTVRRLGVARSVRRKSGDADSPDVEPTDAAARAREICLTLLAARPRSRAELAEALLRRGIPEKIGESVLERLGEVGLVDDAAFAETAVHSGRTYRGLGTRALSAELRRRGVPDDVARRAVAAVRPEDEEEQARELVRRKLRTATRESASRQDSASLARRLIAMLARKGYAEGLALRVVREELGLDCLLDEVEPSPD